MDFVQTENHDVIQSFHCFATQKIDIIAKTTKPKPI